MAIPVKLPVFEGPLDLLMHLIEKNKIDIYDIPIVEITDQYLEYVRRMDHEDMDVTSEFLVMAATLLDIKSRMLLPREKNEETGEEEGDPREELVQRLLEYKMYKYLSEELAVRREETGVRFFRAQKLPKEVKNYQPPIDYGDLLKGTDLKSLEKVFGEVLRRKKSRRDPIRSGFGKIRREQVNMDTKALYIRAYLQSHPQTDFRALLESQESREEVIVTFLILLELMKTQKVHIVQDSIGGKILVEAGKPEGPDEGSDDSSAGNPEKDSGEETGPGESPVESSGEEPEPEESTEESSSEESGPGENPVESSIEEPGPGENPVESSSEEPGPEESAEESSIEECSPAEIPGETAIEDSAEEKEAEKSSEQIVEFSPVSPLRALRALLARRSAEVTAPFNYIPKTEGPIEFSQAAEPKIPEKLPAEPAEALEPEALPTESAEALEPEDLPAESLETVTVEEFLEAAELKEVSAETSEEDKSELPPPQHYSAHLWHGRCPQHAPGYTPDGTTVGAAYYRGFRNHRTAGRSRYSTRALREQTRLSRLWSRRRM